MPCRRTFCSGRALSRLYQFKQGVADWIEIHKSEICEYSIAKLEFRHSNVLRMAYVSQKLSRALTAMSAATDKEEFLANDEIGPIALGGCATQLDAEGSYSFRLLQAAEC